MFKKIKETIKSLRPKTPQPDPKVSIRPADIHDILPVTLLWAKMTEEVFDNFTKLDKVELDKFSFAMADRLRMPHTFTQIAEDKGKAIGFIHGYIDIRPYGKPEKIAFCECLYVEQEYRDGEIAKKLIDIFIGWAKMNQLPIEFLTKFDPALINFWDKYQAKPYSIIFRREK